MGSGSVRSKAGLVPIEARVGVEAEVVLGRAASGGEGRRGGRQAEVAEEDVDGLGGARGVAE